MDPLTVFSPTMIEVCDALGKSRLANSFYLAGGTALALHLGHRKSDDLDFFPRNPTEIVATGAITREMEGISMMPMPRCAWSVSQVSRLTPSKGLSASK